MSKKENLFLKPDNVKNVPTIKDKLKEANDKEMKPVFCEIAKEDHIKFGVICKRLDKTMRDVVRDFILNFIERNKDQL